jgi:hypothetical protein
MDAGPASGGLAAGRDAGLADGEVVWSWRRDRGVYPACLCGFGNGDNKRRSPGRVRISRKTIARGKPGCPGCTRGLTRVLFCSTFRTRDCGRSRRPAFPAPSNHGGTTKWQNSGRLGAAGRGWLGKCARSHAGSRRLLCMGLFSMFLPDGYEQERWWTHKGCRLGTVGE